VSPEKKKCLREVPANSVASLYTHDMPPFASFWNGSDVRDLEELGLCDAQETVEQLTQRRRMGQALAAYLSPREKRGAAASLPVVLQRCQEWLSSSPAKLLLVNLEDLWLETEPQNVPGTHLERPNWQRKARLSLEQFGADPRVVSVLQIIARLRSRAKGRKYRSLSE
jgi:4-alpha-glucanotransferase